MVEIGQCFHKLSIKITEVVKFFVIKKEICFVIFFILFLLFFTSFITHNGQKYWVGMFSIYQKLELCSNYFFHYSILIISQLPETTHYFNNFIHKCNFDLISLFFIATTFHINIKHINSSDLNSSFPPHLFLHKYPKSNICTISFHLLLIYLDTKNTHVPRSNICSDSIQALESESQGQQQKLNY